MSYLNGYMYKEAEEGLMPRISRAFDLISHVESGDYKDPSVKPNPKAIDDSGKGKGIVQVEPIMLKDVQRINPKFKSYTHDDMFDPAKAREVFFEYNKHYIRKGEKKSGRTFTLKDIGRMWNGGPSGYKPSLKDKKEKNLVEYIRKLTTIDNLKYPKIDLKFKF